MSSSDEGSSGSNSSTSQKRLRGIRRRKWGKWVSEIRVPGTRDRLWLGTYSSPEAAAVAHDIAKYCLRENASLEDFNFPLALPSVVQKGLSPRSVQKVASNAGMAIDAQFLSKRSSLDSGVNLEQNCGNIQEGNWQYRSKDHDNWSSFVPSLDAEEFISRGEGGDALNISVDDYL